MDIKVTQRDGRKTDLDISKIRNVVEWACDGLDVNPIALEAGLTAQLKDGITSKEIQGNLINCALTMCSPEEPDWRYVAGRLHIWGLWKDTRISREFGGYSSDMVFTKHDHTDYKKYVKWQVDRGVYDKRITDIYDEDDLTIAGDYIYPLYDKDFDYAGASMLSSRYLLPGELPQEAFLACALLLASVEKPESRLNFAHELYLAIAQRKISLATPILANLRVPNGSLSSCFIVAMDDNLESIYREITNTARISKNGGGVGVNVSRIRATGGDVMGRANASGGVIPWIKLLNDTAIAVNQGGRRAGAVTVALDVWHLDVPEFLEMQTENGDQRRKAYDVFPQLVIPDLFMEMVKSNGNWVLLCPHEVKQVFGYDLPSLWGDDFVKAYLDITSSIQKLKMTKTVKAKDLCKEIMRCQIETGMPYLAFKDTINEANPNKHDGTIPSVNLCVAGETKILTDRGEFPIRNLAGEYATIWNGYEWSEVFIRKTSNRAKLITVVVKRMGIEGCWEPHYLTCTLDHKWHVIRNDKEFIVPTSELLLEDKSISYGIPDPVTLLKWSTYFEVVKIMDDERYDSTYCFNEPKRHLGVFNGILTGQCTESFSNVTVDKTSHCCNLVSLNLANIKEYEMAEMCYIAVRLLDNTIDLTTPPIENAKNHNNRYRTIGVGAMGLADWLAKQKLNYSNLKEISELFESIAYSCTYASMLLSKERGFYQAFNGSEWHKGKILGSKPIEFFINNSATPHLWQELADDIQRHGIRNSHITAIAPNTASSLIQGCTASVLPVYSRFFYDKNGKGSTPIAPPFIKDSFWYYQENKTLDQKIVVKAVAEMQKWIDTGISMELLFNLNEGIYFPDEPNRSLTAKDIFDTLFMAWEMGCKTVYYVRTVQKDSFKESSDCVSCAN